MAFALPPALLPGLLTVAVALGEPAASPTGNPNPPSRPEALGLALIAALGLLVVAACTTATYALLRRSARRGGETGSTPAARDEPPLAPARPAPVRPS
ncbi:MAG TPA: hypothetical protein VKP11_08040 [Frankiaceae bacterium]|nr:hypothetical protein [Frankiaceae bacterium]